MFPHAIALCARIQNLCKIIYVNSNLIKVLDTIPVPKEFPNPYIEQNQIASLW